MASRNSRPTTTTPGSSLRGMMDSVNLDDDEDETPASTGPRVPPPVQPPANAAPQRQTQPSVSVEQAAKPSFNIYVGDPHKVGDLTSSHTEYSVTTKVCLLPKWSKCLAERHMCRRLPKAIGIPNLPSRAATVTSCGYITNCTVTIPELLFLPHRRSRLSAVLRRTLLNRGVPH